MQFSYQVDRKDLMKIKERFMSKVQPEPVVGFGTVLVMLLVTEELPLLEVLDLYL